ncbi:MAG: hypothetical protein A2087_12895 [Spirochaetes bacterium GWD1_61_31]|nr:MAG: hypothetical protein A2Y37_05640 [Spirochaetes bacterium GWB1_60_80]OHD34413.1 MAG: hypothetical protein A2004_06995 [Spirochaetes bacterium GWC1_61_12]OHD35632.1 MAG: hypothetical protein A2087_12895 [Spirochaetes bacterium GWD1_61_31]OHD41677.1 MAG: hypothetical protein A2Y35_08910 [Spirochaetes bacterium GWE1_60_18]OHD61704.1 MAG: hypothetical protein A2Y32_03100 [Spirochaetes bacterium GWF1_60_12]
MASGLCLALAAAACAAQRTGSGRQANPVPEAVVDVDGTSNTTVRIGDQVWMAENLRVTRYRNGEAIPVVAEDGAWANLASGACCTADNTADPAAIAAYGRLYNWYAANDSRGLAPEGWHIPSVDEWQELVDCLGGSAVAGGHLKAAGIAHWPSPNVTATDSSGFAALPGGVRDGNGGPFFNVGRLAYFGLTAEAAGVWYVWYVCLGYENGEFLVTSDEYPTDGFSIRCVKDDDL